MHMCHWSISMMAVFQTAEAGALPSAPTIPFCRIRSIAGHRIAIPRTSGQNRHSAPFSKTALAGDGGAVHDCANESPDPRSSTYRHSVFLCALPYGVRDSQRSGECCQRAGQYGVEPSAQSFSDGESDHKRRHSGGDRQLAECAGDGASSAQYSDTIAQPWR